MNFVNPNSGAFVWSRNASDIIVTGASVLSGTVQFTVFLNGTAVSSFGLTSSLSGQVILRFREILEAILPKGEDAQFLTAGSYRYSNTVAIRAEQGDSTASTATMVCFRGGSDELRPAFPSSSHWLTWKPQITDTWPWAREILSCIVPASTTVTVQAKVYFAYHSPVTVTVKAFASQGNASIGMVDCSPTVIEGLANVSNDSMIAYDVFTGTVMAHRFILRPTRLRGREFLFRNSLGVIDTVFATGDVGRETESAVTRVRINRTDQELSNEAEDLFKVQTGHIRDRRMMLQWQEFARSTERYVRLQGDVARRISVTQIDYEMTEHQLSGATVTYHYADTFTGRYFNDTELEDYDYTSAE